MGHRRRRLRLAEGADDAARPRDRRRLAGGARGGRRRRARRASTSTGSARAKAQAKLDAPFTPAVSLVLGARRRARAAPRGGARGGLRAPRAPRPRLPRRRQGDGARALLAGRRPLGRRDRGPQCPTGVDCRASSCSTLRDRLGIQLIGGQGELKGKIFRIGHIGYFDVFDITTALAAVELGARRGRAPTSSAASP